MNQSFYQKLFLALCFSLFALNFLQATIITVDNNSNSGGQYTNLQIALDAAQAGDTIHVIGSNTSYGSVTVRKQLTIIGAGYNPPNQFGLATTVSGITLSGNTSGTASNSKIMGFLITSSLQGGATGYTTSGITIERCDIWSTSLIANNCSNWVMQNNILDYLALGNNSNIIIRNNFIGITVSTSNQPNVLFTNNIFTSTTLSGAVFSNVDNAVISNNIFYYGRSPQGCDFSTFNNNITFNTSDNTLPYGNNSGLGNLVNIDPQFTSAPTGGYNANYDYRLQANSQGVNAGTDNTDIGVYGSINPFPIGGGIPWVTSAPPAIPQIIELDILNSNITQGDSLQVHIRARKQN